MNDDVLDRPRASCIARNGRRSLALVLALASFGGAAQAQEVTLADQIVRDMAATVSAQATDDPWTLNVASICGMMQTNRGLLTAALDLVTDTGKSVAATSKATMLLSAVTANAAVIDGLYQDAKQQHPSFRCYSWKYPE